MTQRRWPDRAGNSNRRGPTTGSIGFTENSQLLQFGSEETCVSELEYQVSSDCARNSVAGSCSTVIPKYARRTARHWREANPGDSIAGPRGVCVSFEFSRKSVAEEALC